MYAYFSETSTAAGFGAEDAKLLNVKDTNATVFVIDDDPSIREAIDSLIRSVGINVRTFASAQEFIWEQRVRPSQRNCTDTCGSGAVITSGESSSCGPGVVISTGGA